MPPNSSPPNPPRRRNEPGRRPGPPRGPRPPQPGGARPGEPVHERELLHICGLPAVEALFARDPGRVERLFFEPRLARELAGQCRVLGDARKPYRQADAAELARVAGTVRHGGVVAVARPRPLLVFDPNAAVGWARERRPLLLLDGIGNPHNLGAIVRSAGFFGVERVLLADRPEQALPSDAAYRVAEGALDRLLLYQARMTAALPVLQRAYRIVGTAPDGSVPLGDFRSDRPVALILGNEETGLDRAMLEACDSVVAIPGRGRVQSLNVAAAAAILLYALTAG
jgi:RNA methyltransferase, TrmH family